MAYESLKALKSLVATSTLAAKQYYFVKLDANGQIVVAGSGNYAIGVVQDKPAAGQVGSVCGPGDVTKVYCGGTFAAGDEVSSDSSGKAVAATSGAFVLGQALTAGADGYVATIIYQPKGSKL